MYDINLFENIFKDIRTSKETELVTELIEYAVRYAQIRVEWQLSNAEKRIELDRARTLAHNAFIDSCNILSRAMEKLSEPTFWREQLGTDRKFIGDFACYIHFEISIRAR